MKNNLGDEPKLKLVGHMVDSMGHIKLYSGPKNNQKCLNSLKGHMIIAVLFF